MCRDRQLTRSVTSVPHVFYFKVSDHGNHKLILASFQLQLQVFTIYKTAAEGQHRQIKSCLIQLQSYTVGSKQQQRHISLGMRFILPLFVSVQLYLPNLNIHALQLHMLTNTLTFDGLFSIHCQLRVIFQTKNKNSNIVPNCSPSNKARVVHLWQHLIQ